MKLMQVALFIALMTLISAASAQDTPNLVGTWQGPTYGHLVEEGFVESVMTFEILDQQGRVFHGEKSWVSRETGEIITETFSGTVNDDGLVAIADHEDGGTFVGQVLGDMLTLQYVEGGPNATAYVTQLTRQ